jgi:hypothetical protein
VEEETPELTMGERKTTPICLDVPQDKDHFTTNLYQSNLEEAVEEKPTQKNEKNGDSMHTVENSSSNNTFCTSDKETVQESEESTEEPEPAIRAIQSFCYLVIWPLDLILPVKAIPELAIGMIIVIVFYMTRYILFVIDSFCAFAGLSFILVGTTMTVWCLDNLK